MIEAAMYMALGVLSAVLVALMLIPPFWRRAVRLNRRDIEATLPMTRAEIAADKDQLRADFAVSTRRLETVVERLESKVAAREVELGQKSEIISHLTAQGSLTAEGIGMLERERDQVLSTLKLRDEQIAEADAALKAAENRIVGIEERLDAARQQLEAAVAEREAERLERVARDTEIDNLNDRLAALRSAGDADGRADEIADLRTALASEEVRREAALESLRSQEAAHRSLERELRAAERALGRAQEERDAALARAEALATRLAQSDAAKPRLAAFDEERAALGARIDALETANAVLKAKQAEAIPRELSDALRRKLVEIGEAVAMLGAAPPAPQPSAEPEAPPAPAEPAAPLPVPVAVAGVPAADRQAGSRPKGLAERIRALQQASKAG